MLCPLLDSAIDWPDALDGYGQASTAMAAEQRASYSSPPIVTPRPPALPLATHHTRSATCQPVAPSSNLLPAARRIPSVGTGRGWPSRRWVAPLFLLFGGCTSLHLIPPIHRRNRADKTARCTIRITIALARLALLLLLGAEVT